MASLIHLVPSAESISFIVKFLLLLCDVHCGTVVNAVDVNRGIPD